MNKAKNIIYFQISLFFEKCTPKPLQPFQLDSNFMQIFCQFFIAVGRNEQKKQQQKQEKVINELKGKTIFIDFRSFPIFHH